MKINENVEVIFLTNTEETKFVNMALWQTFCSISQEFFDEFSSILSLNFLGMILLIFTNFNMGSYAKVLK
jgi:hypothetical protein